MSQLNKENNRTNLTRVTAKPVTREPLSAVTNAVQTQNGAQPKGKGLKVRAPLANKPNLLSEQNASAAYNNSKKNAPIRKAFEVFLDNTEHDAQISIKTHQPILQVSAITKSTIQKFAVYKDEISQDNEDDSAIANLGARKRVQKSSKPFILADSDIIDKPASSFSYIKSSTAAASKLIPIPENVNEHFETTLFIPTTVFDEQFSNNDEQNEYSDALEEMSGMQASNTESFSLTNLDSPMILDVTSLLDPLCHEKPLLEYSVEMYEYLRDLELNVRPKPHYMSRQPDITHSMRTILVDWLVEVGEEYKMNSETLYLTVSFMDRFLSCMSVQRTKLQLVGTASMFIASKYEEIYPPELSEFVYITDDTYTKKQVLRMEHLILKALCFDLAVPTINYFVLRLTFLSKVSDKVTNLSRYLCELSLLEGEHFLKYLPSQVAAASVALANYTLGLEPWSQDLQDLTGYLGSELEECVTNLHKMFLQAPEYKHQAIVQKYKSPKYDCVSLLTPPPMIFGQH